MDSIELFLRPEPGDLLVGDRLAQILREWLARTPLAGEPVDMELTPDGEEAIARIHTRDQRVLAVRLHHEGGPTARRLIVEAWTWMVPQPPSQAGPLIAGVLVAAAGVVASLVWLSAAATTLAAGLVASILLGILVARISRRATTLRQIRRVTEHEGGQRPAQRFLAQLDDVIRSDQRVERITER